MHIEDLAFAYGDGHMALDGLTLSIARGEFACVLGPSGCGKSTLLGILSGLFTPQRGRVMVDGALLYEDGRRVTREASAMGYVFQDPRLLPWRKVRQNVELALRAAKVPQREWQQRVDTYLEMCGIGGFADSHHWITRGLLPARRCHDGRWAIAFTDDIEAACHQRIADSRQLPRHDPDAPARRPDELSVNQVARRLGISTHVVYYWLQRGHLPARHDPTGSWAIPSPPQVEAACRQRVAESTRIIPKPNNN